ncbi:MAG: hypothetical protein NVS9B8_05490 [Candidatus Limnocylindrales bacterium]
MLAPNKALRRGDETWLADGDAEDLAQIADADRGLWHEGRVARGIDPTRLIRPRISWSTNERDGRPIRA